jgi:protein involved in polysaccharide export with SLBB domain
MSLFSPLHGIPSHRLPPQFLAPPKNDLLAIDISRLSQPQPRERLVDARDILGIFIEGVLGSADEPPPVNIPQPGSDLPPSIGYPIPVREDGTLPLPLIPPVPVKGLTLTQIENVIRRAYTVDNQFLQPGKERIIVTLMKLRTYRVTVMRQDGGLVRQGNNQNTGFLSSDQFTRGYTLDLPAYKNDILNALAETGGLPGVDAINEVKILRSSLMDQSKRDAFVAKWYETEMGDDPCLCQPPLPDDPAILRIPLRLRPGQTPTFNPEDVILEEGDIVLIEGREREVFYTGGLLGGGEYPLPRDYDLDVIGAMSVVGGGVASPNGSSRQGNSGQFGGSGGGLGVNSIGGIPPGQLFILRKTPCDGQIIIAVDLNRAINSPAARPLVQAGDILVLMYKPQEEIMNFGLGAFFAFGITELFRR